MKISEKLDLTDKVSRALQAKYGYGDIDLFLKEFGIGPPKNYQGGNSKWLYSKSALSGVKDETLLKIAEELQIENVGGSSVYIQPPRNWKNTRKFRLFISHLSKDKNKATRMRDCLEKHSIAAFVAHEDIHPTLEWMEEIQRALFTMDAFLAIHTKGFKESYWSQQEVGFAVARGVKIISLRMGEDPQGFISKHQAISRNERQAEEVADEIVALILDDKRTDEKLRASMRFVRDLDDSVPF
ncbi:MAG: toll/interleukin-1 receptor domain-containing protein [Aestuariivirga sp.]